MSAMHCRPNIFCCGSQCSDNRRRCTAFKADNTATHVTKPKANTAAKASTLPTLALGTTLAAAVTATANVAQGATEQLVDVAAASSSHYVPSPIIGPSWEIWVGFAAGVIPFIIASVEFGKRIVIQQRCPECQGRGLVQKGKYLRKCQNCGGLLPWLGWRAFWFSNFSPGNGGPLLQPKGQTSVLYSVPPRAAGREDDAEKSDESRREQ